MEFVAHQTASPETSPSGNISLTEPSRHLQLLVILEDGMGLTGYEEFSWFLLILFLANPQSCSASQSRLAYYTYCILGPLNLLFSALIRDSCDMFPR